MDPEIDCKKDDFIEVLLTVPNQDDGIRRRDKKNMTTQQRHGDKEGYKYKDEAIRKDNQGHSWQSKGLYSIRAQID